MRVHIKDALAPAAVDKVYCNGFEQKNAIMADDVMGVVERYKVKDGKLLGIGDCLCREEINGRVKIVLKPGWSIDPDGTYQYNVGNTTAIKNNVLIHKIR